ncbi:MAG: anion permease [Candidatus Bipolaricaulota bacterium]|nr:anion permease [Candidatus Bipolaricaulota bacterium]MDW8127141.1 anion permease [Candidatus Bipolaricaulota bacterium]
MGCFAGAIEGWAIGANAAANVCALGIAVGAWRYRTALTLSAILSVLGAYLGGKAGMNTYVNLASHGIGGAFCATLAAGLIVAMMSWRGLPVPGPQAIVGAIVGVAIAAGRPVEWGLLGKIVASWVINPLGACLLAYLLSRMLTPILSRRLLGLEAFDRLTRVILIFVGLWGAFALGANNVPNVTGVFVGAGLLPPDFAGLIGGGAIALGVLTYSRPVIETVGRKLVELGTWPALLAVTAEVTVLQSFAAIGVPVSTAQAVVGAVVGVGLSKGVATVNFRQVWGILAGWVLTPTLAGGLGFLFWLVLSRFFG